MFKLSLIEKIGFRIKEGIGLGKNNTPEFLSELYDIKLYKTKEIYDEDTKKNKKAGYWTVEKNQNETIYTHISKKNIKYYKIDDAIYLFGTEGIFYKKSKDESLKCIVYGYQYTGCTIYPKLKMVILFGDSYDTVNSLNGTDTLLRLVRCDHVQRMRTYTNNIERYNITSEDYVHTPLVVMKNGCYEYFYVDDKEFHNYNISFYYSEDVKYAQKGELIVAYDMVKKRSVVVTVNKGELKKFDSFDNIVAIKSPRLNESWYMAYREIGEQKEVHFIKHIRNINESEYKDLGKIPYGEYQYCDRIDDVMLYKKLDKTGTTLIAVDGDNLKVGHYKADDVYISQPEILEENTLFVVKPIFIFKKRSK